MGKCHSKGIKGPSYTTTVVNRVNYDLKEVLECLDRNLPIIGYQYFIIESEGSSEKSIRLAMTKMKKVLDSLKEKKNKYVHRYK